MAVKKEEMTEADLVFKIDGYENAINGAGVQGVDGKQATRYRGERILSDQVLADMWRHNGLGKRLIKLPIQDAFREGYKVNGDDDGEISNSLEQSGLFKSFKRTVRWADVFGGGIMLLGIKDGGEFEDELNEDAIDSIDFAHVFDRTQCYIDTVTEDPADPNFGKPEFYNITPINGSVFQVHHSRVIRIDGEELNETEYQNNSYWHDSIFQSCFREIERAVTGQVSASRALDELYIYVMKMKGLSAQLGQKNEAKVIRRLNQLDLSRHTLNMIAIDENEEFLRNAINLSGIESVLTKIWEAVSMVRGIPLSLLAGQTPQGLGNADESGMTFYYDTIRNKQEEQILDGLNRLVYLTMISKDGPTKGVEIPKWKVTFNPIERQSETEIVTNRKMQSETDQIYMTAGVVAPTEVRDSRFGGLEQSLDTDIDPANEPPTAEEIAKMALENAQVDPVKKPEEKK